MEWGWQATRHNMRRSSILVLSLLQLMMVLAASLRIDTHCHYVPTFYKEILDSNPIPGGFPAPEWNVSAHLALNEKFGITTSIVSASTPGAKLTAKAPLEEGRALARKLNEYGRNLTVEYPGRFLFFASLTLPDLEGSVAEAIHALDTLGAAGVGLFGSKFGELLGTPRYAPLYKVLDDRKAVVFIHPGDSACPETAVRTANSTDLPPYVVDFLLDTTRAALNLVYRNVTVDYPNIKFILAHSGGFLPFAGVRAASILGGSLKNQPNVLEREREDFHVDLAISATQFALPSTMAFFKRTQITFGSDFPHAPFNFIQQNTETYMAYRMGNGTRRRIDNRNARQLFKKFLK